MNKVAFSVVVSLLSLTGSCNCQGGNNFFNPQQFVSGVLPGWSNYGNSAPAWGNSRGFGLPSTVSQNWVNSAPMKVQNWGQPSNVPSLPNFGMNNFYRNPFNTPKQTDKTVQENFNASLYTGLWHEIYRTKNAPNEYGTDNIANYTLNNDSSLSVFEREWIPSASTWRTGVAVANVVGDAAHFQVKYLQSTRNGIVITLRDYRIMFTDYYNIAVILSLDDDNKQNGGIWPFQKPQTKKYGWILGRTTEPSKGLIDYAFVLFQKQQMNQGDFIKTQQGIGPNVPLPIKK